MTMINKHRYILLIFAFISTLVSCDDWISDVKQTTRVTDEIVWRDETSVDTYINSFYILLHQYGQFGTLQFNGSLTESLTDAFKYGSYSTAVRAGHPNNYAFTPEMITTEGSQLGIW